MLRDRFGFDNTPFLQPLEALGFRVADQSRSNYAVTRLSVPSSRNMDFLDALGPPLDPEARHAAWLDRLAKFGAVRRALQSLGYRVIAFESGYGMTEWVESDQYLSPRPVALSDARAFGRLSAFEVLLLQTSMARLVVDGRTQLNALLGTDIQAPHELHRERILFTLDRLARMPEITGPKFVFAHLLSPRPPYVFTADGGIREAPGIFTLADAGETAGPVNPSEGYPDQVTYLDTRLLEVVEAILRDSETEPIIILQGDHGAMGLSSEDRMKILNAYYLPGQGWEQIHDRTTPVNKSRLIFNMCFGGRLPLLDDRSYFSPLDRPFDLTPIQ